MQWTSKIILAQHSNTHPIKPLNTGLIIMFPIVPFHQGFQSQIYNSSIKIWASLILIASKASIPFSFLCCGQSSNWIWWTINHSSSKSSRREFFIFSSLCSASWVTDSVCKQKLANFKCWNLNYMFLKINELSA